MNSKQAHRALVDRRLGLAEVQVGQPCGNVGRGGLFQQAVESLDVLDPGGTVRQAGKPDCIASLLEHHLQHFPRASFARRGVQLVQQAGQLLDRLSSGRSAALLRVCRQLRCRNRALAQRPFDPAQLSGWCVDNTR
jgi:hypothetical protein